MIAEDLPYDTTLHPMAANQVKGYLATPLSSYLQFQFSFWEDPTDNMDA